MSHFVVAEHLSGGTTSPPFLGRLGRYLRLLGRFLSLQALVQLLGFACGLLLVRFMPKSEYAFYTIALSMQGMFTVLSESGTSIAVFAIGGRVWHDRQRFSSLINTAARFRNVLGLTAAAVIAPLMMWLLLHNHCPAVYALFLTGTIVATGFVQLGVSVLLQVPLLQLKTNQVQKTEIVFAVGRLFFVGVFLLWINALLGAFAAMSAFVVQQGWLRRKLSDQIDLDAPTNAEDRAAILASFRSQALNTVYYCAQGQLTIWLISVFGNTSAVADLGALGRLAFFNTIIGSVMTTLIQPRFARLHHRGELCRMYWLVIIANLVVGGCWVGAAAAFPRQFLWLLGANYQHITKELVLAMAASGFSLLVHAMWILNSSKGWIKGSWANVPATIAVQVLLLCILPVGHLDGAILFGAFSLLPSLPLNLYLTWRGLRNAPL